MPFKTKKNVTLFFNGLMLDHQELQKLLIKDIKVYYSLKKKIIKFKEYIDCFNDKDHSLLLKSYRITNEIIEIKDFQYFLCGIFWKHGSISKNKDSLIIDIHLLNKDYSLWFSKLLMKYDIHSFIFRKNSKYFVRIKNTSSVANALLLLNCKKTAYNLFDNSISMEIKKQISGSTNFQIYNDVKSMKLATKQIKAINELESKKNIRIPEKERIVFNYRKKHPYASIRELTSIINTKEKTNFSISTVYRCLKRVSISNKESL